MGKLLEPARLFDLTLRTRTISSATWEGLADEKGFLRPEIWDWGTGVGGRP